MRAILLARSNLHAAPVCFIRRPTKFLHAPSINPLPITRPDANRSVWPRRYSNNECTVSRFDLFDSSCNSSSHDCNSRSIPENPSDNSTKRILSNQDVNDSPSPYNALPQSEMCSNAWKISKHSSVLRHNRKFPKKLQNWSSKQPKKSVPCHADLSVRYVEKGVDREIF